MARKKGNTGSEERVLNAAIREFALKGFAGARVDAIADKAKVNKAMIYYHFKSKEKLYERILKDITDRILSQVREAAVAEGEPDEVFYSIVNRYIGIVSSFEISVMQILMREIASGGKYFRRVSIPNLAVPVFSLVDSLIGSAVKKGKMRKVNPYYTFMQILGGIIFFHVIRIPIEGSALEKVVYKDGYLDDFRDNLFNILKNGIELTGGRL